MPAIRKLELGNALHHDLPIRPQFSIQHVVKAKFIDTAYSKIVPRRMKGQRDQRIECLIVHAIFLILETEHPQQLAFRILVVPDSNSVVLLGAGGDQWSLQTYIHGCDRCIMETLEQVIKKDVFFFCFF